MNRSGYCIQMLSLLFSRGTMSKEALAKELGVKIRNISEYRKELEMAGYSISTTSGKYGGYTLERGTLLPMHGFTKKEAKALQHSLTYLKMRPDFYLFEEYQQAMDRILSSSTTKKEEGGVYLGEIQPKVTADLIEMMDLMEYAQKNHYVVSMQYKGMHDETFETILIHPYEILNYKGSYYCMAYSLKAKDYRNFKFSKERMRHLSIQQTKFSRDVDFRVKDHVGSMGLIQDEVYELVLLIQKEQAVLMAEKSIGLNPTMRWKEPGILLYQTTMEGRIETISFLLSLGDSCTIIEPIAIKEEIQKILQAMLRNYAISSEI